MASSKKILALGIVFSILIVIIGAHWLVGKVLGAIFGGTIAILLIFLAYYFALRTGITYLAFPGSLKYNQRKTEF